MRRGLSILALIALGGCGSANDIVLVLKEVFELPPSTPDAQLIKAAPHLRCDTHSPPVRVTSLCIETYALAVQAGKTTKRASCHDVAQVTLGAQELDLAAALRGLGTLAEDLSTDPGLTHYLRITGYGNAARSTVAMCGVSPSFPKNLVQSTPAELAVYLICNTVEPGAAGVFEDYCSTSSFITVFP